MRAQDFFRRAQSAERNIRRLERLMAHYFDVGSSISPKWGAVGGGKGNNSSRVETAAIGRFAAEMDILDEVIRYREIVADAERVISRISQDRFREILTLRYLEGKSFTAIQAAMEYSCVRSVYRVHGYALREAQVILNKKEAAQS